MGMTKNGNGATPADVWEFDWNGVTRGEMMAFNRALNVAARQAKEDEVKGLDSETDGDALIFPVSAKVVKRWPYDHKGKPDDVESYNKLGMGEYTEWYNRFWATFPRRTDPAETKDGGEDGSAGSATGSA
jgi:hypothetical protein